MGTKGRRARDMNTNYTQWLRKKRNDYIRIFIEDESYSRSREWERENIANNK